VGFQIFEPKAVSRAIINIEIKVFTMSSTPCASCVVVLNQQQEQNISHQKQCEDIADNQNEKLGKNCTVVENGRVVVKPLQQLTTEISD
jgi:hypothetical protein